MTISPFGWKDFNKPAVSARNLEAMLASAGAYTDSATASVASTTVLSPGSVSGMYIVDFKHQPRQNIVVNAILTGDATVKFINLAAACEAELLLSQDGVGGHLLSVSDGTVNSAVSINTSAGSSVAVQVNCPNGVDLYVNVVAGNSGFSGQIIQAGNLGSSYTLNFGSQVNLPITLVGTLNANVTVTVANRAAGCQAVFLLTQDGTGGRSFTISDGSTSQAVSGLSTVAGATDLVEIWCPDASNVYVAPITASATAEDVSRKDQPNGYPSLDGTGRMPAGELPTAAVGDTSIDSTSPVQAASAPRNRALRDFVSVLDYGTYISGDMTSVFQAAMNAASTKGTANSGKFKLLVPPNAYQLTSLIPKSWVDIHAHGASFTRPGSYVTDHSFFFQSVAGSVGSPITQFALRGATVIGTGTESAFQGLILLDRSSHITIEDVHQDGVASFLSYLGDCQHARVQRNKALNGSVANQFNFVNGAGGLVSPLKYIWCENNFATCNGPMGIAVVTTTGANRTDPIIDAHLNHNTCTTTGSGWPMTIEQGGTGTAPNVSTFEITGNTLTQNGTGLYALTLTNDSTPASNDPLCIADVTITGNRLYSLQTGGDGLYLSASDASITGNIIHATVHDIFVFQHGTAVLHHITETGNTGHHGSGSQLFINTAGSVDLATLTSLNTP